MKNQLPPNFKSWNQLYTLLKERGQYHEGTMNLKIMHDTFKVYHHGEPLNPHFYQLELDSDFLKARCFDEIQKILNTPHRKISQEELFYSLAGR